MPNYIGSYDLWNSIKLLLAIRITHEVIAGRQEPIKNSSSAIVLYYRTSFLRLRMSHHRQFLVHQLCQVETSQLKIIHRRLPSSLIM